LDACVQDETDMEAEAQRLQDEQREADQKEKDEFEDRLKNRDLASTKQVDVLAFVRCDNSLGANADNYDGGLVAWGAERRRGPD
jgi:hypothetical protein